MAKHSVQLAWIFVALSTVINHGFELPHKISCSSTAFTCRWLVAKAATTCELELHVPIDQTTSTPSEGASLAEGDDKLDLIGVSSEVDRDQSLQIQTATWDDFFTVADLRLRVFLSDRESNNPDFRVKVCKKMLERRDRGAVCIVARSLGEEHLGNGFFSPPAGILENDEDDRGGGKMRRTIVGCLECSYHEFDTCKGGALGTTATGTLLDDSGRRLYLTEVAVDCRARRRGVGRALLEGAMEEAKKKYYNTLYLHVDVANDAALCFYHKAGFRALKETKATRQFAADLGLTSGDFAAATYLLMSKRLDVDQVEPSPQEGAYAMREDPFEHIGFLRPEVAEMAEAL
eukprot:CAMPEP_0185749196 /NCGR_PEP_ID=MMETSP1174-20130828/7936_1 /TAXON_ID=35687 /ORGANISM="Dictyocha speculum, Strain CCMP1381" /LENGTH=345 /DNA_ID=CAMNT_0028425221 /DNA_START=30 /DNA_END=1068 /DNA_ORIENTATION=-